MERGGLGSDRGDRGDRRLSPPDARRNARGGIGTVFLVSASPDVGRVGRIDMYEFACRYEFIWTYEFKYGIL